MKKIRYHLAVFLFACSLAVLSAIGVAFVLSLILIFQGGSDHLINKWRSNEPVDSTVIWPSLLLGGPSGAVTGYRLWHWFVLKIALLNQEDVDRLDNHYKKPFA